MKYTAIADTDIGISRKTNEDSVLVKHAVYNGGEVLLTAVCDGMGGLSHGELASATVVREFSRWFQEELPRELAEADLSVISGKWEFLLKDVNTRILEYAKRTEATMGTTFTGMLFINDRYVFAHVGDSRIYHIGTSVRQLTTDHTFVAREVSRGAMTQEEAEHDKRRNKLTQCIGVSPNMMPQIVSGRAERGTYLLCTDGFRHKISEAEMAEYLRLENLPDKKTMFGNSRKLIDLVMQRQEKDNISVALVKADVGG